MRGRRGQPSSSVTREHTRMALRKQPIKDVSSESQQMDEDSQEDDASADRDDGDELSSLLLSTSSPREKRKKGAGDKSKPKEMTEEEMMDFALRLSEQEASVTALQQQQEEEAMMKAIQESMVGQTQPCRTSASHTLLTDASLRLGSRRKLSYPNGEKPPAVNHSCTPDSDLRSEAKGNGEENISRNKKRKWRAGSPLLEMPDLSQTQKISSQASPCRSESSSAPLDSPQSSDSTQIDDSQIQMSPVFPMTGCRAAVQVDRLSHDLVETCRNSGFVLCSQETWTLTQKSDQPKSPTFPQSNLQSGPKSSVFSDVDQRVDGQTEQSPEYVQSPVFGRNTQHEKSPSACKHHVSVCSPACENAGLVFSSQESLRLSVRSGCPKSPVFPKSPGASNKLPPSELLVLADSPDRGQTERSPDRSASPVFGTSAPQQRKKSTSPSAAELRGPNCEESSSDGREDTKSDGLNAVTRSPASEEPKEKSKDCNSAAMELTSDMTLVWSGEEEDDVTPVGSPSPVFPEDTPSHRAENQAASLNHVPAASLGTTGPKRSPSPQKSDRNASPTAASSSTSTGRQLLPTTETEQLVGRELPPPEEPSDGHTVHYYWGVPFCPRGLDPDRYTQVIVAQMEVYEKSLKEAQRRLLRKAEWGEAVLPQPEKCPSPEEPADSPHHHLPRRRGLRLRGNKTSEAADSPLVRAEEDGKKEEEELQEKHEEDNNERDDEQMVDDWEVCLETQLSDVSTQDVTIVADASAEPASKSPDLTEIILRDDSPAGDEPQEELADDDNMKENIPGCSSAAGGQTVAEDEEVKEDTRDPDVEEVKDRSFPRSASPDLEPAVVPHSPESSVDCPICQASFPATEIEMHAAYCDGEVAVLSERRPESHRFKESLKPRGKRWRRAEQTAAATNDLSNVCRNQEKCYICQKNVPLSDYRRHIDLCLQPRVSRSAARGNLLSALEQTESRDSEAGPSGSKPQPEAVIDLRDDDDDDEDGEASAFRISNSPIRSFTPISEATGCLIDFKKQQRAKKPSQRRR